MPERLHDARRGFVLPRKGGSERGRTGLPAWEPDRAEDD